MPQNHLTGPCTHCKAPVITAPLGYVHDQTLGELRVTMEEYDRVMENALANRKRTKYAKVHDALHQPKPQYWDRTHS
jgi:hypothetical protein